MKFQEPNQGIKASYQSKAAVNSEFLHHSQEFKGNRAIFTDTNDDENSPGI